MTLVCISIVSYCVDFVLSSTEEFESPTRVQTPAHRREPPTGSCSRDTTPCFTSTVSLTEFYCVPYCHNQIVDVNLQYDVCFKTVWHYRSSLIIVKYNNWILYLNFISQFDNIYIYNCIKGKHSSERFEWEENEELHFFIYKKKKRKEYW